MHDMLANIRDLTWRLCEGHNCLVHCAGGSGRTGMIIAGIVKNVGVKDPVAWVRRVKATYVETAAQEAFVNKLPPVLDERIVEKHPNLAKAVAAAQLLQLFMR
jgi:protein tyrosine/serine phosphatase